jgi:hypothetical protein
MTRYLPPRPGRSPLPTIAFPNRVDVVTRPPGTPTFDAEGGRLDVDVTVRRGLECSVQPGAARLAGPESGLLLAEGQVPVYFPRDPGVSVNDELVQTDVTPHRTFTVVDSEDQGGLGLVWMAVCQRVEGAP